MNRTDIRERLLSENNGDISLALDHAIGALVVVSNHCSTGMFHRLNAYPGGPAVPPRPPVPPITTALGK